MFKKQFPDSTWKKAVMFLGIWMLFFTLSIVVRLPHFLSRNFFFDGDEAIIGIMAQDFLLGKQFPMYFYGQNYGFSMFEVFSTSIFIKLLGSGIWALRLGGLLIFSLGTVFIFKTFQERKISVLWSFLIVILVLCFPTWYLWGGMVRGGYVTAFTLCCALFYVVHGTSFSMNKLIIAAVLAAFTFESHVLILVPFAPFIFFWILKQEKWLQKLVCFALVFVAFVGLIRYVGYTDAKWPKHIPEFGLEKQLGYLSMQTEGLMAGFSNFFFFSKILAIPFWWQVLLWISLAAIGAVLILDFIKSSKFRRFYYLFFVLSLLVFCFLVSTVGSPVPRYWIGMYTGILFVLLFIFMTRISQPLFRGTMILLTLVFLAGIASGSKMKSDWTESGVNEMKAFENLHKEVQKYNPKGVFITDNLIQYQWNYLYGKEIPASAFRPEERTNEFRAKVDSFYQIEPSRFVIAGMLDVFLHMDTIQGFNNTRFHLDKYFVNPNAANAFVEQGRRTMRGE